LYHYFSLKGKEGACMASIGEDREFESWVTALRAELLTVEQIAVLQGMVDDDEAESLERAAQRLDWQETVIDPTDHMYGH
jgi:hypothetical protein